MSFQIKEKLIDLNDSLIKFIDFFVFLPKNRLLVLGKDSALEKNNKFKILYEVWDLYNNYVMNEGKLDIYAITYVCKFIYYKDDYVINIKSLNGQRSLVMFDFITNTNKIICSNINSTDDFSKNESRKTDLFSFPSSSMIVFLEVLYFNGVMTYSKERDEYYLYNFIIFKENDGQIFSKFKLRREFGSKNKENTIKVIKGNDKNLIVIFDYNLNEIIIWNFLKNYEEIKYVYMNFQDFKILRTIDEKKSLLFILKDKKFKQIQIMHLDMDDNRCIMNNLFSLENFEKNIDFSKISSNKVFFFERYNKVFLFILMKFQNSFETTHYFIYEYSSGINYNENSNSMFLNSKFILKLNYERNSINNYFFKQKECFESVVCLTKPKTNNSSSKNSSSSDSNGNSKTMRIFSLLTPGYEIILEKIKLNFFFLIKKENIYEEKTIKLMYRYLVP